MASAIEQQSPAVIAPRIARDFQEEEVARDLAFMDEIEAFAQSLPQRGEGHSPTTQEIRELAYEEREAELL